MEDEIDLGDYWFIIKKNLWLIIPVFLIILAGAVAYTFYTEPTYEATSLVVLTGQDQTSFLLGGTVQRVDIDTQTEIVRSAAVLGLVYNQIIGEYEIDVQAIKNSNVIQITAQSPSRMLSMQAANSVAEAFINYTLSSKVEDAVSVSGFITDQITAYEKELDLLQMAVIDLESINRSVEEELALQNLIQTIAAKEKLYNYLLNRREEISITAQESASTVKIIQYAEIPVFPVKPNIPVNLALGIVLGIMGSVGLAFAKEYKKNAYRSEAEVQSDFGPVMMGTLPKTKITKLNKEARLRNIASSKHKGKTFKERVQAVKDQKFLSINFKKDSPFAEEVRKLRTNVKFYLTDEKINLISVTSPQKGDGKTTVAVNLALSLAQNESKVLLIDANLRAPALGKMFGKPDGIRGFSDVILGDSPLKEVIKETKQKKLDLITSGSDSVSPPELFGSHRMKSICNELKRFPYDAIIIDTSSLEYAEATALAADTQGTLLVVGHDKTKKEAAAAGKAALAKVNVAPFGVVLNWKK